ncbi:MAG: hypothetical protein RL616_2352 [Verrucomicrobiota bacterium]|jgi:hypothetical protein
MSFENPTRLRIGMHGVFAGKDFRLIGRVVMGVEIEGETYYWNEFNLQSDAGDAATLVYEETEGGATWRLFTEFEPDYPMTAADAVLKQVGDVINLTGEDVRVTLVDSSRVYRVEGLAPRATKVGSVDNYFNAELRDKMLAVSWTGQAVEFYQGITLSAQAVARAFRLTAVEPASNRLPFNFDRQARLGGGGSADYSSGLKFIVQAVVIVAVFLMIFGRGLFSGTMTREAPPVKRIAAATPPLAIGVEGRWHETKFRIIAHAVVEIAEPGVIFDRHEYMLADDLGTPSLLVCGDAPGATDWTLYAPLVPLLPPTAPESATKKSGDTVNVDGVTATITELFQSTVKSVDVLELASIRAGDVSFGYAGSSPYNTLFVRWDKSSIHFYRGKKVSPQEFAAIFSTARIQ